jgi:phosphonate transport system permease protein
MSVAQTEPVLKETTREIVTAWERTTSSRRLYTVIGIILIAIGFVGSVQYADEANAGHFFERLPHLFDFLQWLIPNDWNDVWRALFDRASPLDNGSEAYDFAAGRVYIWGDFYIPEYFELMITTLNIAILSTIVGFLFAVPLAFMSARNITPSPAIRFGARRICEFLRAFPELVFAGLFAAILSAGPVPAIFAIILHTIGALGKLFYEIIENIDMKPDEGVRSVGGTRLERIRFAALPQVLPNLISYGLLRLEINVRASTIIGAVGGGGIGEELRLAISRGFGAKTLALLLLLFLTIIAVDQLSAWMRKKLVGEHQFLLAH